MKLYNLEMLLDIRDKALLLEEKNKKLRKGRFAPNDKGGLDKKGLLLSRPIRRGAVGRT